MSKHIAIVCDSPRIPTGYARIGRFVAKTLHEAGYKITYFPCNSDNPESKEKYPYQILPHNPHDRYFNQTIVQTLVNLKPSLVLCFGEFGYIGYVGEICRTLNIQAAYYMPVEGKGYPPASLYAPDVGHVIDFRSKVMQYQHLIAYSEFGKGEIHKILPGIVEAVIPHPVDTKMFRPLDKKNCFDIYLAEAMKGGFENTFVVGAIYRNHRRKGTDLLLRGFKKFLQYERPEKKAILYLVTDQYDAYGFNLQNLVQEVYGLSGRVVLAPTKGGYAGPADNAIVEIYNSFDVHCCPFRAEGWGLNIVESMACGVRTLCTRFASPASYADGVADFITPIDYEPLTVTNCEWAVVHPDDVAKGLLKLYNEDTKKVYQPGVDLAAQFDNEKVGKMWVDYVASLNLPDVANVEEFPVITQRDAAVNEYLEAI